MSGHIGDSGPHGDGVNGDDPYGVDEGETAAPDARYLRLQVELVMEITDPDRLTAAALDQITADEYLPDAERLRAREAVRRDEAEALAYLVDPFGPAGNVPGVELVQASWNSAHTEYDPDDQEWDFSDDEGDEG